MNTTRRGFLAALTALPVVGRLFVMTSPPANQMRNVQNVRPTHISVYRAASGCPPVFQESMTLAEAKKRGYVRREWLNA